MECGGSTPLCLSPLFFVFVLLAVIPNPVAVSGERW
jgi:hypothetical protein